MTVRGQFIVVEGLEGAGKSTALHTIKNYLDDRVSEVVVTREPGGTHLGESVRRILKEKIVDERLDLRAELLLFYAARVQLLEQVILPALQRGAWVLADRFELSTFAYQGGGRKLPQPIMEQLSAFCLNGFKPDLTLFLDIQPQVGLNRVAQRGETDRIEQESLAFFMDVHQCYHQLIRRLDNVVCIDASQPLPQVQHSILTALNVFMASHD